MDFLTRDNLRKNHITVWVIGFLLWSIFAQGHGGTNSRSRYALLQSVIDHQSLAITPYKEWTVDWSLAPAPDKNIYSNKPPAYLFLTLPVYYLFDKLSKLSGKREIFPDGSAKNVINKYSRNFFNFFTKVVPFALLVLYLAHIFRLRGYSPASIHFFAVASLYGTTSAVLMNSFFGHGLSSLLFLAMMWCWLERRYYFVGLLYGFTLLNEFAAGAALIALLPFFIWDNRNRPRNILQAVVGGVLPAILWCWYHISIYGSPFLTSMSFPNPEFVFGDETKNKASAMFTFFPNWKVFGKLIYGSGRGLLVTQPWVFIIVLMVPFIKFKQKFYAYFMITLLFVLMWMNSLFWGWHGGGSPGPRYLSISLALFPLLAIFVYNHLNLWQKRLLWFALGITLLFRCQLYATNILAPHEGIWIWQWETILAAKKSKTVVRFVVSLIFFLGLSLYFYRKTKKNN